MKQKVPLGIPDDLPVSPFSETVSKKSPGQGEMSQVGRLVFAVPWTLQTWGWGLR